MFIPLLEVTGNVPVKLLEMNPSVFAPCDGMQTRCVLWLPGNCSGVDSASSMAKVQGDSITAWCDGQPLFDLQEVNCTPYFICFVCPISVASSMTMNLLVKESVIIGHPLTK